MIKTGLFLLVSTAAFFLCFRAGYISLLTWEWLSVMKPQAEAWESSLINYQNMFAGLLTAIAVFAAKGRKAPPLNIFVILFFIFSIFIVLSQIFSLNSTLSAFKFNLAAEMLFLTFAILLMSNTKLKIQALLWVFVISVGYYGVTRGLMSIASGGRSSIRGAANSILQDNNQLAMALASMAPLALYLFRTSADAKWFSRMQTIENASQDNSFMTRVKAWDVAYHMGLKYPVLGAGGTIQYYPLYNSAFIAEEVVEKRRNGLLATHNAYLEILAGNGFIAFGAFLGMIGTAIMWCSKINKVTQNIPGLLWAAELGTMLQISLVVYAIGSMALST
ncbi:MAG: DUF5935 domain-containing protein, partial [Alphaproteobacteria bacterium]